MSKPAETFVSIIGSPREEALKKIARMYRISYKDAFYYAQVFDTMLDALMRMGCEITIEGVISTKVKRKNAEVEKNRKYINNVLSGKSLLYGSKYIHEKEINLENKK